MPLHDMIQHGIIWKRFQIIYDTSELMGSEF